jgi:hypothetical protein
MQQSGPPIEWVEGGPTTWFFLGNFVVLLGALYLGQILAQRAIPAPWGPSPLVWLAWLGIMSAIVLPANVVYFLSVPCPRTLGLSPVGVTIDFGMRRKFYAWKNVFQRDGEVVCFPSRGLWPNRVALSVRQGDRVRAYRGVFASAQT